MRVGMGYDVHKLVEGRPLILGGVTIPYEKGLLGHSDADCLVHAIMDSLLGAAALGDIGKHFPDTDPRYEGADSMKLLSEVKKMLDDRSYIIGNIDATIIAQKPKMASFIPEMRQRIADTLEIELDRINVKATTEEGLGFTGEGLGISCQSIALLETIDNYVYRNVATGMIDEVEGRGTLDVSKEREQAEKIKENRSRNHG
ncbi:MAG: 2-C-methyl-D-erythritol 2,4-cyclodiphosphate synthase [Eubacterium sp.]|nr:2-C-methyl-D-erythritol 2,4-cyclodiphosphate synthase [Eubacterium sp.]MBQ2053482.1 2-C-methyl-D-erythritol 2,4-cyclodiphosphate synthase [Eubacterium sp.]MEE3399050.1 2-C-methyl-D-erythritol 2,4-cyclodiphosphate synthase [Eubacterium sp.]